MAYMRTRRDTLKGIIVAGASTAFTSNAEYASAETGPEAMAALCRKLEIEADKMLSAIKQLRWIDKHKKQFEKKTPETLIRAFIVANLLKAITDHGAAIGELVRPLQPKEKAAP